MIKCLSLRHINILTPKGIYYLTSKGLKEIADKLERNKQLLVKELEKAGVLIAKNVPYYTKATRQTIKVYKLKFSEMIEPNSMETGAVETEVVKPETIEPEAVKTEVVGTKTVETEAVET